MDNQNLTAQAQVNAVVLANAADIGARVIARIAGNDIANTLHGESATKDKLSFLLVGLALDLQGAGSPERYTLEAFKWAFAVQIPFWALGITMMLVELRKTRGWMQKHGRTLR
jgi:hypothetical protein